MTAAAMSVEPDAPRDDDSKLVQRAAGGDRAAFERLYRLHRDHVYGLCWRLSGAQEDVAMELAQQAFVRAWNKLSTFRGDSKFGTWLHRLTVNVALSDRRIRVRQASRETSLDDNVAGAIPAGGQDDVPLRMDLERAIATLPERARTVLVLHDVEGLRHQDIADMTGIAVGTSKAHLHRARQLVRERLTA